MDIFKDCPFKELTSYVNSRFPKKKKQEMKKGKTYKIGLTENIHDFTSEFRCWLDGKTEINAIYLGKASRVGWASFAVIGAEGYGHSCDSMTDKKNGQNLCNLGYEILAVE
jgi:hypothetical protein